MSPAQSLRTDSAVKTAENAPDPSQTGGPPAAGRFVRIDSGHPAGNLPAGVPENLTSDSHAYRTSLSEPSSLAKVAKPADEDREWAAEREQSWLQLHAIELIEKLQSWSEDLDAREAQLNSRTALLEHRERQLRLERQNSQLDLAEIKVTLQREAEELRAAARRLAFE